MLILQNGGFFLPYWDLCKTLPLLRGLAAANRCSFVEFLPHLSTRSCLSQHLGARVLYERSFYLAPNGSLCTSCGWFSALLTSRLLKLLRHSRRPSKKPFKNKCTKTLQKALAEGIEASRFEKSFQPRGHAMTTHI